MREQTDEYVVHALVSDNVAERRENDGNKSKVDKAKVEERHVVEHNAPESAEHVLSVLGVTLVEGRAQRSRRFEGLGLSTKPCGQDEGSDDAEGNVRRHPELITGTTLTSVISRGYEEDKLAQSVRDDGSKARSDEPSKLGLGGVGDQRFTHGQDDGNGKERDGQKNGVDAERGVEETGEALGKCHLLDLVTVQTKLELERGVDGTDSPTRSLLQMAAIILGNGAELERLMDKSSLPSLAQHEGRGRHIFSQGTKREVADLIESLTSNNIARTSAPGNTESVLDRLNNVDEEIQRLSEGVRRGSVVEELRGAGEGHLGVDDKMGKNSTKPVTLGNL